MLSKLTSNIKQFLKAEQGKELALGSGLLFVAKVFGALSGYIMAWLIAKRGGADAVGVYELAFTFIILLSVVARFGLDGAIVRYIGVFSAANNLGAFKWLYKRSIRFSGLLSLAIAALLFLLAPFLGQLFGEADLTQPIKWAAVTIPFFTLLNMNAETLRGFKKMASYSFLQQGSVIFLAVIIFYFWYDEAETGNSAVIAFFVASAALLIASQIGLGNFSRTLPVDTQPDESFKKIRGVAWPIFLSSSIFMLMSWTDTLMIGYFMKEADVGIYRIAFRISTVITFTQFAINGIAAPMIADYYHKKDFEGLRALIHKISLVNFLLSVPIFLIIVMAPSFLLGLFGREFLVAKDLLLILSSGQVVFALSGPVLYILTMTAHEKTALNIMYITAGINILGNAILIPLIGLKGAAIATASTTALWNIIAVSRVYHYLGVVSLPFLHKLIEKPRQD